MVTVTITLEKIKTLAPWKENYDKSRQHIKKQRHHFADKGSYSQSYSLAEHYFANKGSSSQGYGFSCGHVWM